MWGDTESLILLFLKLEVLKLSVGGWQLSWAESLIQNRLNRIYCDVNLLCFWFYSRIGGTGWVQDFIFLFLMLIKEMRRQGEFKIFLREPRDGKILLRPSTRVLKNRECALKMGCVSVLRSRLRGICSRRFI